MARVLSSLFPSHPPLPHPNLPLTFLKPHRTPPLPQRRPPLRLTAQVSQVPPPTSPDPPTPPRDKKSFSVAVGKVFLGITSLLMNRGRHRRGRRTGRRRSPNDGSGSVLFRDDYKDEDEAEGEDGGGGVRGGVGEDEVVVWEQRQVDVEAERRRKVVTSPGFSFSAAGLLFPYHLYVTDFLLENGYIKVFFVF